VCLVSGKKDNFSVILEGLLLNNVRTECVSELHHVDLPSVHRFEKQFGLMLFILLSFLKCR
jgi:hypothetical protein